MLTALRKYLPGSRTMSLRVPRSEEDESALLLGDPGTGKSQILHQVMRQLTSRKPSEAVVCYDPAGEFVRAYYDSPRGDVIFNPLDARSPYWSPSAEVLREADCEFVAESFFPSRPGSGRTPADFFGDAARVVFARMLERRLPPDEMLRLISDEDLLDELMEGTGHAHLIDSGAKGQRAGVLATLDLGLKCLKYLPRRGACEGEMSLSAWAAARCGVLFITGTPDSREALRQLHAPALNILLKRLRSGDERASKGSPCAVLVDEAHTLGRLPALSDTLVEGRKYGVKLWLGAQNKTQWEDLYGRLAPTILAAPHLKIFLRCGEAETARWASEMIGEEERERPRVGTTATVQAGGRDSVNYTSHTERRALVSKEEIMSLRNLCGFWKYENAVVPFRLMPHTPPQIAPPFIPREAARHDGAPPVIGNGSSAPISSAGAAPFSLSVSERTTGRASEVGDLSYADIDPNF